MVLIPYCVLTKYARLVALFNPFYIHLLHTHIPTREWPVITHDTRLHGTCMCLEFVYSRVNCLASVNPFSPSNLHCAHKFDDDLKVGSQCRSLDTESLPSSLILNHQRPLRVYCKIRFTVEQCQMTTAVTGQSLGTHLTRFDGGKRTKQKK